MVAERRGTSQGAICLSSMGLPFLVWDNVPLGAAIGCPAIERALTTEVYSDRVLGVSEYREVSAHTVMAFTGNNIAPRGDLSSRSLVARIVVDRPDPENRKFTNADPVGWTEQNRGDILSALYTILLGNPRFHDLKANKPAETRFKAWWHLVGAAIEHAACCCDKAISFKNLFLDGERDDEQSSALGEVLKELRRLYRTDPGFRASDIAERCRAVDLNDNTLRSSLEVASGRAMAAVTVQAVSHRLRSCLDRPVRVGDKASDAALRQSPRRRFVLREGDSPGGGAVTRAALGSLVGSLRTPSDPWSNYFKGLRNVVGSLGSLTDDLIGKVLSLGVTGELSFFPIRLAVWLPRLPPARHKSLKTLEAGFRSLPRLPTWGFR